MHEGEKTIVVQPEEMWHRPLEMDELGSTPPAGYPMSLIESTTFKQDYSHGPLDLVAQDE